MKAVSRITKAEFECLCDHIERSAALHILEIGTLRGGTAAMLAKRFPRRWVWSVDIAAYAPDSLSQIPNLVRVLADSPRFKTALTAIGVLPSFALVFFDGSHIYADVKKDFELWSWEVAQDGYIAFHDAHVMHGDGVTMDGTTWNGDREGPRKVAEEAIADGWDRVAVADSTVVLSKRKFS